jgi:predicted RND superfamily exporter protein
MLDRLFSRHSFKIILVVVLFLPALSRGAKIALKSNNNNVQDWLPEEYEETQAFKWFRKHFENETFVLVTWDGCTLSDQKLELFAQKILPVDDAGVPLPPADGVEPLFCKVETGQRLLKRMTENNETTNQIAACDEDEAAERLRGLFVGPRPEDPKTHKRLDVKDLQTCAVVTLTEAGKKDLRKTLATIKQFASNELAIPPRKLRMGGPPVDNVAIATEGERTLMWLLAPAGIVGVSLAFWCLRSIRLTVMVFCCALLAAMTSLSIVTYTFGTMNAILLTMPAVVYVAAVSGAIHFSNYYRDAIVSGGPVGACGRAIKQAWLPCTLSTVTTAAGLISLYTSELIPIKWFGIYSAAGVVATMVLLFVFLPAWMTAWPAKKKSLLDGQAPPEEDLALPHSWRNFLSAALGRHGLVFTVLMALMLFSGYGLFKVNTTIKLTKMFSDQADIIRDYEWLEARLGPLIPMEVIVHVDKQTCSNMSILERMRLIDRVQQRIQKIDGIGNTLSAVTFAPSLKPKRGFGAKVADGATSKQLDRHREDFIKGDLLADDGNEELWRISARAGALNDIDYGEFINEIKAAAEPILEEQRKHLAKAGVLSDDGTCGIRATYTGLVPVVYKAQRAMLDGLAWNFLSDLATVAGVMTLVFWDWWAGIVLLIPSIFPVIVVFGVMGWLGIPIDVGSILTPTVALGVSVDDVMHFLIWYRQGLRKGMTRHGAIMHAYEDCARAMYQSWAVLGLGLAVFALSSFVPTQRFGALMFFLLTAALIGNLFLLPAILAGPISHFFCRRAIRQAQAAKLTAGSNVEGRDDHHGIPAPHGDMVRPTGEFIRPPQLHIRTDSSHQPTSQ